MESFRQDLSNDVAVSIAVAEHRSILKNRQNTCYTCFGFIPKNGTAFRKTGVFTVFDLFLVR